MPNTWEYKAVTVTVAEGQFAVSQAENQINTQCEEGWELLSVTPLLSGGDTSALVYHFRRGAERRRAGFTP